MLHPSYSDLMNVVNENAEDDTPVVNSRYSIVMATAKRARQIIADEVNATPAERAKPLSAAVRELNEGYMRIVSAENDDEADLAISVSESLSLLSSADEETEEEFSAEEEDASDDREEV